MCARRVNVVPFFLPHCHKGSPLTERMKKKKEAACNVYLVLVTGLDFANVLKILLNVTLLLLTELRACVAAFLAYAVHLSVTCVLCCI